MGNFIFPSSCGHFILPIRSLGMGKHKLVFKFGQKYFLNSHLYFQISGRIYQNWC